MFATYKRNRRLAKVKAGDGSPIQRYRFWQLFARSVFAIRLPDGAGGEHLYEVDVRHGADSTSKRPPAALYRDGVQVARATLPVTFPVPGGLIEVATNQYGLKRMHYLRDDRTEHLLTPLAHSTEGLRARFGERFPFASAVLGVVAVVLLVGVLAVQAMSGLDALTNIEAVAAHTGDFTTPLPLTWQVNFALIGVGLVAGFERAATMRHNRLLGG
ncbi:hypothetical protein WIS52_20725 [Pseudonocardia nematodicida]|uniref:Uncharacterized protein n=1 Tax=Pseudonocardia nematodicida TaxID=1206997 RepID=A0ABV1KEL0_9PSEU